jgi:hypothetical protein
MAKPDKTPELDAGARFLARLLHISQQVQVQQGICADLEKQVSHGGSTTQ